MTVNKRFINDIDDNLKGHTFDFTLDNVLKCMNVLDEKNQQLIVLLDLG